MADAVQAELDEYKSSEEEVLALKSAMVRNECCPSLTIPPSLSLPPSLPPSLPQGVGDTAETTDEGGVLTDKTSKLGSAIK